MNGRDIKGAVAALASVSKLPFQHAHDGISYTFAISPSALGKEQDVQVNNLVGLLDGYFTPTGGQHLNVNVFDADLLIDSIDYPCIRICCELCKTYKRTTIRRYFTYYQPIYVKIDNGNSWKNTFNREFRDRRWSRNSFCGFPSRLSFALCLLS